ncbi:MAG: hydroxymethylbilane synthase [Bdellovibrionales bacterium]
MLPPAFKVVTRSSRLALTDTMEVISALIQTTYKTTPYTFTIVPFDAIGDRERERWQEFAATAGEEVRKRKWTYDLEMAIVEGAVDIAVHSGKDLSFDTTPRTLVYPVCDRADPRDIFIGLNVQRMADLPPGAKVGTNSLRRRAQILAMRPDLDVVPYGGNITTRIDPNNMRLKNVDGIVIAAAGLQRMNMNNVAREYLAPLDFMPAVSQGILAVQIHERDRELLEPVLQATVDPATAAMWVAERELTHGLEAGCDSAIGGYAIVQGDQLRLYGRALAVDGSQSLTDSEVGPMADAEAIGRRLAQRMAAKGAKEIMQVGLEALHATRNAASTKRG